MQRLPSEGHRKRDCSTFEKDSKKGVNAVDQAPGLTPGAGATPSGTPSRVSMSNLDDWILADNVEEHEKLVGSIERVMVDSEAAVCVPARICARDPDDQSLETCDFENCHCSSD